MKMKLNKLTVILGILVILLSVAVNAESVETDETYEAIRIESDQDSFDVTTSTMTVQVETTTATFQEQIVLTGIDESEVVEMDRSFELVDGSLIYVPFDENALADVTFDGEQKSSLNGTLEITSLAGDELMFFIIDVENEELIDMIVLTETGTTEFSYDVSDVQSVRFFAPGVGSQSEFSITDIEFN